MKKFSKINLIVLAGVLIFSLFAIGSGESTSTSSEKKSVDSAVATTSAKGKVAKDTKPKEVTKPDFELLEDKVVKGEFSSTIVGKIKNNTDSKKGYVQVQFNLYDKEGSQVGTAMANVNNLEAGGTWKFEAMILEKNVASYKLSEITGF